MVFSRRMAVWSRMVHLDSAGVRLPRCRILPHDAGVGRPAQPPRDWLKWLGWASPAYGVLVVATHPAIRSTAPSWWELVAAMVWVVSCTVGTLWVLAMFLRFVGARVRTMDSLCENAYGIYLVHYLFVTWLQYLLLPAPLAAVAKGGIVFFGALALSWASVAGSRQVPGVARVI